MGEQRHDGGGHQRWSAAARAPDRAGLWPPDATNWMAFPANRWTFQHIRELFPTARLDHDPDRIWRLPSSPVELGGIGLAEPDGITVDDFLASRWVDGIAVLHRGRVVFERYLNGMGPGSRHHVASVSKSVTALAVGALEAGGLVEPGRPVTAYLPELAAGPWAGATIRDVLDMAVAIDFGPSYDNWSRFTAAAGWWRGDSRAESMVELLRSVPGRPADGGQPFSYCNCNSAVLALVAERASGMRFAELLAELLWKPLGAEFDGDVIVGPDGGAAAAAAGLSLSLRDLARVGELVLREGASADRQVVPARWARRLGRGEPGRVGRSSVFQAFGDATYGTHWWRFGRVVCAIGAFGQLIAVDPATESVVAMVSSEQGPWNLAADRGRLRLAGALAGALAPAAPNAQSSGGAAAPDQMEVRT
jgi:CubicO group peptidase (beta-lactamase class C family)